MSELIRSIGYDQGKIIQNILRLHVPEGRIDCGPTFSTGDFTNGTGNRINRCFGAYPDEKSLCQLYVDAIREAYRVLKPGVILIFECQDKVSSGKQYYSHVFVMNTAVRLGFYPKDLFILLAKNILVADWQTKNQKHARKYHCYFWVFEKSDRRIAYT